MATISMTVRARRGWETPVEMVAQGKPFMIVQPVDEPGYAHPFPGYEHTIRILACRSPTDVRQPGSVTIDCTNVTDGQWWGRFQVVDTAEVIATRSGKIKVWEPVM
jgi:hypothetical protein